MQRTAELQVDKDLQAFIPSLTEEEYSGLEQNILDNGCRVPIDVWGDVIIDGHNRYEICRKHDIPFKVNQVSFDNKTEAMLFAARWQLDRRNLQPIDRICIVQKCEDLVSSIKEKAREKQKEDGRTLGGNPTLVQKSAQGAKPADKTREKVAKLAGVSHDTYKKGVEILQKATPDQIKDMRSKKSSINRVYRDIKKSETHQRRQKQRQEAGKKIKQLDSRIIVGDFRDHFDAVPDNSVSLIFTDPPYDRKSQDLFDGIGEFADRKLIEGGSVVCYVGQINLQKAMVDMSKHLRYWWTICCLHSGQNTLMREYGIRAKWKPVLWYVKKTRDDKESVVVDVMSGGMEKEAHEWQQAKSEAEYWIEKLCPADGVVCDLFLGSGTTALAAQGLNREWIGFEKDPDTAKAASEAVANDKAV